MPKKPDLRVILCDLVLATRESVRGATAYIVDPRPEQSHRRMIVFIQTRRGQWILKWEDLSRLARFREANVDAEHALYGHLSGSVTYRNDGSIGFLLRRIRQAKGED